MAATTGDLRPTSGTWRTPLVIIVCGCAIALLSFGPRSSLGFFVQPMSHEFTWGRDVFGLALALQNLLWGLGQPIAGAIADRFGLLRVMVVGALLYAAGLLLMRYSTTPLSLDIGAGVLIGFGLSGSSFNLVLSAFSKLLPPRAARHRARRRHRRGLVRPIPVRAVRRRDDRQFRLADRAPRVWRADAADPAAVAGALDAAGGDE
ncbi:MFS family permease [Bradyrhizobium elkanii]|uniref:MFS family permease n=1 Tax=Bradyrhizobium elkanii TaxID=29448 RepID=A0ABV4F8N1_BRAEL